MNNQSTSRPYSQRQLRVGELVKQNLGQIFLRNEAKIPSLNTKLVTVTEVRMSSDLKSDSDSGLDSGSGLGLGEEKRRECFAPPLEAFASSAPI